MQTKRLSQILQYASSLLPNRLNSSDCLSEALFELPPCFPVLCAVLPPHTPRSNQSRRKKATFSSRTAPPAPIPSTTPSAVLFLLFFLASRSYLHSTSHSVHGYCYSDNCTMLLLVAQYSVQRLPSSSSWLSCSCFPLLLGGGACDQFFIIECDQARIGTYLTTPWLGLPSSEIYRWRRGGRHIPVNPRHCKHGTHECVAHLFHSSSMRRPARTTEAWRRKRYRGLSRLGLGLIGVCMVSYAPLFVCGCGCVCVCTSTSSS